MQTYQVAEVKYTLERVKKVLSPFNFLHPERGTIRRKVRVEQHPPCVRLLLHKVHDVDNHRIPACVDGVDDNIEPVRPGEPRLAVAVAQVVGCYCSVLRQVSLLEIHLLRRSGGAFGLEQERHASTFLQCCGLRYQCPREHKQQAFVVRERVLEAGVKAWNERVYLHARRALVCRPVQSGRRRAHHLVQVARHGAACCPHSSPRGAVRVCLA